MSLERRKFPKRIWDGADPQGSQVPCPGLLAPTTSPGTWGDRNTSGSFKSCIRVTQKCQLGFWETRCVLEKIKCRNKSFGCGGGLAWYEEIKQPISWQFEQGLVTVTTSKQTPKGSILGLKASPELGTAALPLPTDGHGSAGRINGHWAHSLSREAFKINT